MSDNDATADGSNTAKSPGLDTIVVDPDDVVAAMRRNKRDERQQRTHVLRVSPPFEGEKRATPHVSEAHTYYPPEMVPEPLHIPPEAFLVGHSASSRHPDWRTEWSYPSRHEQRSLFRDEFGARDDGANRPLTDDEKDEWAEWWDTVVELWEDRVRHALKTTEELTITHHIADTTVSVRFETSN